MIKNFKDTHHVAKSRETYKLKINGYVSINFLIYMFFFKPAFTDVGLSEPTFSKLRHMMCIFIITEAVLSEFLKWPLK